MICTSVRIVRVILRPFIGPDTDRRWRKNPVEGHRPPFWHDGERLYRFLPRVSDAVQQHRFRTDAGATNDMNCRI